VKKYGYQLFWYGVGIYLFRLVERVEPTKEKSAISYARSRYPPLADVAWIYHNVHKPMIFCCETPKCRECYMLH
jgi:hypothetical protein